VAALGVEYLRFADGLAEHRARDLAAERHQEMLNQVFKAALAAKGDYTAESVFPEHFAEQALPDGSPPPATDDSHVDFDYSGVEWGAPGEDEMAILERMLQDTSVTVGQQAPQVPANELPQPRAVEIGDIEQDREWV